MVRFEWDPRKAEAKVGTHGIALAEAVTVLERTKSGGNYQTLINDALLEYVHRRSTLDAVRQVVREELAPYEGKLRSDSRPKPTRSTRG